MKRLVALFAVVLAAAVVTPFASADLVGDLQSSLDDLVAWDPGFAPFADPPPDGHEYVVGSHKESLPNGEFQHVRVSAHSLPGGVNPKGQVEVTFDSPLFTFYFGGPSQAHLIGDVDCLNVGPGIGQAEHPGQTEADVDAILRTPYGTNTHIQLITIDNGNPGPTMGMSPDLVFIGFTNSPPPGNCSNFGVSLIGNAQGNIVAHDVVE